MKVIWSWTKRIAKVTAAAGIIAGLFSYAMFQGNFVSWFLFYSVMTMILLMLLYALIPLGRFHVERRSGEGALPSGAELTTEIRIERKWLFPFLYLAVEDVTEEKLTKQLPYEASRMIFYPTTKKELVYRYTIPHLKRGKYHFYGVKLSTSDMFGFIHKEKFVSIPAELLVYPKYHEIDQWNAYEKQDEEASFSFKDYLEDQTSLSGAREYVPGDKMTSMDWKASARAGRLMTKEFEDYAGQNFLVVLNNRMPGSSFAVSDAYEKGIELVASILMFASKEHLQMSFISCGSGVKRFPAGAGGESQKAVITYLAQTAPAGTGSFVSEIKQCEADLPSGVTLVFVSLELTDEIMERIKVLLSRKIRIFFALMDKGKEVDAWEHKRLKELRGTGAEAYVISEGKWSKDTFMNKGG
jgi:uncharacterized protein (DUF58 family)